jgi:hypothetical protein
MFQTSFSAFITLIKRYILEKDTELKRNTNCIMYIGRMCMEQHLS